MTRFRFAKHGVFPCSVVSILAMCFAVLVQITPSVDAAPYVLPKRLTLHDPSKAYQGYTVYALQGKDAVYVVDMNGKPVHTWTIPGVSPVLKPLPYGHILVYEADPPYMNILREYNWDGKIVWQFRMPEEFNDLHHDFMRLPNGNTLCLATQRKTIPSILPREVQDDVIFEIGRDKKIIWQWSTLEHYDQLGLTDKEKTFILGLKKADVFHTNSVQALPKNKWEATDSRFAAGNILVSQRNTNRLLVIDKNTGEVVWRLNLTIGQHHASMIPQGFEGEGNILVFDNGGIVGYPPKSRINSMVREFDPSNKQQVWRYDASDNDRPSDSFLSLVRSGTQRLPNGNTLIVESTFGRIFEVTRQKEVVWEYLNPYYRWDHSGRYCNQIYRAYRVDPTWPTGKVGPGNSWFVW